MVHHVQCPHCQTEFNASQEQIGQRAQCSKCGRAFVVSRDTPSQPDDPLADLQAQLNEGPSLDAHGSASTKVTLNKPLYRDPNQPSERSKFVKGVGGVVLGSILLFAICNSLFQPRSPVHPLDCWACDGVSGYIIEFKMTMARDWHYQGMTRRELIEGDGWNENSACEMAILDYEWSLVRRPP